MRVLICSSSGPDNPMNYVGLSRALVSSAYSKTFNDVRMLSIPKSFLMWACLNQFCSLPSSSTSVSLRLNSSFMATQWRKLKRHLNYINLSNHNWDVFYNPKGLQKLYVITSICMTHSGVTWVSSGICINSSLTKALSGPH